MEDVRLTAVRYTPTAVRHLTSIASYLRERNPEAARRVGERIREVIELLTEFPEMGHSGPLPGTREAIIPRLPYIVVYRFEHESSAMTVLGVYHGAQIRPGQKSAE